MIFLTCVHFFLFIRLESMVFAYLDSCVKSRIGRCVGCWSDPVIQRAILSSFILVLMCGGFGLYIFKLSQLMKYRGSGISIFNIVLN